MAQLARMTLRERLGGWAREPFTSEGTTLISVRRKTAERADPPVTRLSGEGTTEPGPAAGPYKPSSIT